MPISVQFSKVTFSQYQARYSPFTTLSLTMTFLACQKASFVSKSQFVKTESVMYWNEYLPLSFTLSNVRCSERSIKYSLSALVSSILIPRTDQPNSGDMMSQPLILIFAHSLSALIPCIFVSAISASSVYQRAARHASVISLPEIFSPLSCQKGYRRLKKQSLTEMPLHSLKALSPSAGPSKRQSTTSTSLLPYSALSSSNV